MLSVAMRQRLLPSLDYCSPFISLLWEWCPWVGLYVSKRFRFFLMVSLNCDQKTVESRESALVACLVTSLAQCDRKDAVLWKKQIVLWTRSIGKVWSKLAWDTECPEPTVRYRRCGTDHSSCCMQKTWQWRGTRWQSSKNNIDCVKTHNRQGETMESAGLKDSLDQMEVLWGGGSSEWYAGVVTQTSKFTWG